MNKNQKYGIIILLLVTCYALLVTPSFGEKKVGVDISRAGIGARPLGLGGAFVGIADDVDALFLNPAGLGLQKTWGLTSMSTRLLGRVEYKMLGGVYPTNFGTFGIGYVGTSTPGGLPYNQYGTPEAGGPISYTSDIIYISYGYDLNKAMRIDSFMGHLSVGCNVKIFNNSFTGISGKGAGYDVDLAFAMRPNDELSIGGTLRNATHNKLTYDTKSQEDIPSVGKLGASYKLTDKILLAGDIDIELSDKPLAGHLGAEWTPIKGLAVRVGVDQAISALGDGKIGTIANLTGGVGLNYKGFRFDYAYNSDSSLIENSSHYFSISFSPEIFETKSVASTEEL